MSPESGLMVGRRFAASNNIVLLKVTAVGMPLFGGGVVVFTLVPTFCTGEPVSEKHKNRIVYFVQVKSFREFVWKDVCVIPNEVLL